MDRLFLRYGYLAALLALGLMLLPVLSGCRGVLTTATYLIKGTNIDAEFDGLRQKKVAVVCRPLTALEYHDSNVARDLAQEVSKLLQANVPKIEVIDQREVTDWIDEHGVLDDFTEIGKALGADMVVAIDLQAFTIYEEVTLYRGKASTTLTVYDCAEDGKVVFEKEPPQSIYPPNAVIPTSDRQESQFRREYIRVLADQLGRHFYAHDAHNDYALDATILD